MRFVLPLNDNGLPLVDSFLAVSFNAMEDMLRSAAKAKHAYDYMVQSLCLTAPPFCLACIGSDNKFTAQHVMLQWKHIYEECTKRGLLVLSFGGDGDSHIMGAMKQSMSLMSASKEPLLQSIPSSSKNTSYLEGMVLCSPKINSILCTGCCTCWRKVEI